MNRIALYLYMLIFMVADVYSSERLVVYDVNDSSIFFYRKNLMSSIFPHISWEKPGLYLFLEKKYLQLFYFDYTDKVEYYQYPQQTKSKWTEPEEYLNEREKIKNTKLSGLCFTEIKVNHSSLQDFYKLQIEEFPYIVHERMGNIYEAEMEPSYKYCPA